MKKLLVAVWVMAVVLGACGGDDGEESGATDATDDAVDGLADEADGASADGDGASQAELPSAVVDAAAPGQAVASVDGLDFTFELPGGLDCSIGDDAITFSYRIGDNEVVLGGGANRVDGGWIGGIELSVANPAGEPGPISYFPAPADDGVIDESLVAVDGASMSYSGPMLKQPANDGSNPPPVDVGTGTISATCA